VILLRTIAAFALVAIGVVGLILPIMPGWLFLIPGLAMLAERYTWAKRLVAWAKRKAGSQWRTSL
jgi:uncharacterized membrane protein YbaN (DUF454 family)